MLFLLVAEPADSERRQPRSERKRAPGQHSPRGLRFVGTYASQVTVMPYRDVKPRRYSALATSFVRRLPPPFCSFRSAAWYLRRISAMSTRVGGSFRPISSIVSAMICDTARLRNHLWFDGMTYQGARSALGNLHCVFVRLDVFWP